MEFKILKQSKLSRARLGILKTPHGEIETPTFVPVATQATVKTLTSEEVLLTKTQVLITNTYHLLLKLGEKNIKKLGGLHYFMNWPRPLMSDSGGFQVFSLGFGHDFGIGKVIKYFPGSKKVRIKEEAQPKLVKINSDGVIFRSPIDGKELFLGPKNSIKIQEDLGADIIFAFDECTPPLANKNYVEKALERTHNWAKICLEEKKNNRQAIFGIIQGSKFKDLREKSAKFINSLGFDGFGIGGDLGESKETMIKILRWTIPNLEKEKPRHLLGIGYLEDIENIIKEGIDTFDCIAPTHYARRGFAFIHYSKKFKKLDISKKIFLNDFRPLDEKCGCFVCQSYSRAYISHLFRAGEITGMKLLTFHNLYFWNKFVENLRSKIKEEKL